MTGRRLATDSAGATIVEFAIVLPLFMILLMGIMDIGQMVYGKSVLTGAVHRAARASANETRSIALADASVLNAVSPILPGVKIESKRTSYFDFADIGRPEKWNDANGNSRCDNNEVYTDENRSGKWDEDIGKAGDEGSANDVVVYSVTARFDPVFKVPFMPARWTTRSLTATAVVKNQPFGNQTGYGSTAGSCP
ncbi:MAG: pilus assembly protein [Novosphingobium sp.]|nr:pilus assembly protein [Novosphingobium sp.]